MLPETSLLPLLQPPTIEFINNHFQSGPTSCQGKGRSDHHIHNDHDAVLALACQTTDTTCKSENHGVIGRGSRSGSAEEDDDGDGSQGQDSGGDSGIIDCNSESVFDSEKGQLQKQRLSHSLSLPGQLGQILRQGQDMPEDGGQNFHLQGDGGGCGGGNVNPNPNVIIQVECGHNVGYMNLARLCQGSKGSCIFYNGLHLTPNEFQFISGRETAKDWKRSIRHNGKSLKLLIKRNLISVHSNSCECFHTNKITPMEDSTSNSTSNDEGSSGSGKNSPVESLKLTSIINKIKSSLKAENGQDDEKTSSTTNNSSGLNLNEKPNKRRRKEAERSSPSESVQSDSEIGIKRSPPPPHHRNYSDFMRSLAAKYNHLPIEPPVPQPATIFGRQQLENNRFLKQSLIDMSSTTALLHLVRSADLKKYHQTPLDLTNNNNNNNTPNNNTNNHNGNSNKKDSNCCSSQEVTAILNWSVDDVCRFVSSIDLCKEYAESFRSQSIDGSGLPLITEEHLLGMGMKLGQALKFKSVLRRRLGNCIICQHCPHCHHSNASNNPIAIPTITSN